MKRRIVFGLLASVAFGAVGAAFVASPSAPGITPPETVQIAAGKQNYRPAGEFRQGTRLVDAPLQRVAGTPLDIMKHQVSEADYAQCVAANACADAPSGGADHTAQTNVNHADATAYARWLSDQTGQHWRLPTDAEWLRAAAERGADDSFAPDANSADPSRRWIASYRREVTLRGDADLTLHPSGFFGLNSQGLADMAGNIWEWTDTCFQNGTLTPDGQGIVTHSDYCGVRAVQGKHRAFVIDFIRDARSGGCAAGVPPDFLGFRLVRDATD
jgi:formylglycine-generating enzyme required for sulfatase activity